VISAAWTSVFLGYGPSMLDDLIDETLAKSGPRAGD
jgi:hypothetical protein